MGNAAMGNCSLSEPITTKDSHVYECQSGLVVGTTGMQGLRAEMEDYHVVIDIPTRLDHTFIGIFDGHMGESAAEFAAENIVKCLESTEQWNKYVAEKDLRQMSLALLKTFLKVDDLLRKDQGVITDGTTAVTVIITPTHIVCANAGDSRSILVSDRKAVPLSHDHKPINPIERKRIKKAGGKVVDGRVGCDASDCRLSLSRAIGDFQFKGRLDLPPEAQMVTCVPDIIVHERSHKDEVLILACDGLWDVMSSEEVATELRKMWSEGERDVKLMAEELADLALEKGSQDNISVAVVRLTSSSSSSSSVTSSGGGGGEVVLARRTARLLERQQRERERQERERERQERALREDETWRAAGRKQLDDIANPSKCSKTHHHDGEEEI